MSSPKIDYSTLELSARWFEQRVKALTGDRLSEVSKLRGFEPARLAASISGLGYDVETRSWVLPLHNIHGQAFAAKLWHDWGEKWITAGWGVARRHERQGEPVGRIFDLSWVVDHVDSVPLEKRWLWVCAGEWDALMLRSVGWLATTSINGESSRPQPEMLLREFGGEESAEILLSNFLGVIVCFDVDQAGHEGSVRFVDAFEHLVSGVGLKCPVKAIDLREIAGWKETGESEGWDVSDLLRWSRSPGGVKVGTALLNAALKSGSGVEAARAMFGIDDSVSSRPTLGETFVHGMHMLELPELLQFGLSYAKMKGSRGQGAYHFGRQASRKGWTLAELVSAGAAQAYKELIDAEMPREDAISLNEINAHLSRSFLDFSSQDNLTTDKSNIYRLHHYYPFLLYHDVRGQWLYWDGVSWRDGEAKVYEHAGRISGCIEREAIAAREAGNQGQFAALIKWSKATQSFGRMNTLVHTARKWALFKLDPEMGEKWDNASHVISTPHGVFDLSENRLLDSREGRGHYCSMTANGSILSDSEGHVRWGDGWERCKEFWLKCLHDWQQGDNGPEVIAMLQELAGLCLRGQLDEYVIVLQGSGRSGKSAFLDALAAALGEYAYEISGEILVSGSSSNAKTSAVAGMSGRRMVKVSEVGGKLLDTDMLKMLTGETSLKGRALYANWSDIQNHGTYWMMTNKELDLRGDQSEALRGRLLIVPFNTTFVHGSMLSMDAYRAGVSEFGGDGSVIETDTGLKSKLVGAARGYEAMPDVVMAWAYEGLRRMNKRAAENVFVPESVRSKTDATWIESDMLWQYHNTSGLWAPGGPTIVATQWYAGSVRSWAELNGDKDLLALVGSTQKMAELLKTMNARGVESVGRKTDGLGCNGKQLSCWSIPYEFIGTIV